MRKIENRSAVSSITRYLRGVGAREIGVCLAVGACEITICLAVPWLKNWYLLLLGVTEKLKYEGQNGDRIEELFLPQEEDRVGDRKWEITEKSIPRSLETR